MDIKFPKPDGKETDLKLNPLNQLEEFCNTFNETYKGHFWGVITKSSQLIDNTSAIINYAFWIDFIKVKDYSYRLFEFTPTKSDGGYPLTAMAFHGPAENFGTASNPEELMTVINNILNSERGRFIILSNY